MLYYLVVALYVITCFVLVLVILLQQGKGGDIASAFGGGASQAAFGARSGATVLTRATAIGAIIFVIGAVMLSILGQRGPGSVLSGRSTPPPAGATMPANANPAAPAPTPAPATPAPATPAK